MSKKMDDNVVGARIGAFFIDILVFTPVLILFSFVSGQAELSSNRILIALNGLPLLLFLVVGLIYHIRMESMYGGTVGKLMLGITVVNCSGERITLRQAFIRNIARIVDGFPYGIPYLVGLVSVATSPTKQRLGDRWAETYVVKLNRSDK